MDIINTSNDLSLESFGDDRHKLVVWGPRIDHRNQYTIAYKWINLLKHNFPVQDVSKYLVNAAPDPISMAMIIMIKPLVAHRILYRYCSDINNLYQFDIIPTLDDYKKAKELLSGDYALYGIESYQVTFVEQMINFIHSILHGGIPTVALLPDELVRAIMLCGTRAKYAMECDLVKGHWELDATTNNWLVNLATFRDVTRVPWAKYVNKSLPIIVRVAGYHVSRVPTLVLELDYLKTIKSVAWNKIIRTPFELRTRSGAHSWAAILKERPNGIWPWNHKFTVVKMDRCRHKPCRYESDCRREFFGTALVNEVFKQGAAVQPIGQRYDRVTRQVFDLLGHVENCIGPRFALVQLSQYQAFLVYVNVIRGPRYYVDMLVVRVVS